MEKEQSQRSVIQLLKPQAERLLERAQGPFLSEQGIEVFLVSTGPLAFDGIVTESVTVMVRAADDYTCGVGVGYVHCVAEKVALEALARPKSF